MPPRLTHLTLLLLVDALRQDYVKRAPYLKHLASLSATGVLQECFGFVPRAAYFGGLDAEQYGFTNMYCFDPVESPFTMAKALPRSPAGALSERLRHRVDRGPPDELFELTGESLDAVCDLIVDIGQSGPPENPVENSEVDSVVRWRLSIVHDGTPVGREPRSSENRAVPRPARVWYSTGT